MAANVELTRSKVQKYLTEIGPVNIDSDGDYSVRAGSARVFVRVSEHPNGTSTLVYVFAQLVVGATASPELFEYIATFDETFFGTLLASKREDGTVMIIMRETLLGDFIDADELESAVVGIAYSGNRLDDDLAERFGGQVFHDESE